MVRVVGLIWVVFGWCGPGLRLRGRSGLKWSRSAAARAEWSRAACARSALAWSEGLGWPRAAAARAE